MKVKTYWLTLDYGYGNTFTFFGLSLPAAKRYKEWFLGECAVEYGQD